MKPELRFKTGKLIIGIVSIVLSFFILFQSCAAGVANSLSENGEVSGSAGMILAFAWLVGGIVGIAARKAKGGCYTSAGFYLVGGIIGIANAGSFGDLKIWAVLSFVFALIFILSVVLPKKD